VFTRILRTKNNEVVETVILYVSRTYILSIVLDEIRSAPLGTETSLLLSPGINPAMVP